VSSPLRLDGVPWERTVLLLVTPDAVARHLTIPLLGEVSAAGFTPIAYRLVTPGPEEIDRLYRMNIDFVWDTYRYRAVDLLFRFGPSLAVLLEDVQTAGGEGHRRLEGLKGRGDPTRAAPDSIRRRLGSINGILSLMHTSESPADAEREAAIFFVKPTLGTGSDRSAVESGASIVEFCRLLEQGLPAETRDFDRVLGGFRAKLAVALWGLLSPEGRKLALDWRVTGLERFAAPGAGAELAACLQGGEPLLHAVLAAEFDPDGDPLPSERAFGLLAGYGVLVDAWERLVLTTSLSFPPIRCGALP
jgi:nucleoside diphosphate kinase